MIMEKGHHKLILFCGPSGSGKSTAVRHVLQRVPDIAFSVSATTRPPRINEIDGKDYYFISMDDFNDKIDHDEFVEWEEVYSGTRYGTLKSEIQRLWDEGKNVIFDIDVIGGLKIRQVYPDDSLAILMSPPSVEVLRQRLIDRNTESPESLERRVAKAKFELDHADQFDKVIINDDLESALREAEMTVRNFISK